ncbi:hypothetical protein BHM03_00052099 [Ensete ventricosum]|nr:hypothetical protein BHM03_00052099 [Ensete ventricosum]
MLPLRFPYSGIRAKVFVRKIGFKLCVMRLYRVKSFNALLLHFRSEGSEEEGRPATASPHAGTTTYGQAAAKAPRISCSEEEGRPSTASSHAGTTTHGQAAAKARCKGRLAAARASTKERLAVPTRGGSPQGRRQGAEAPPVSTAGCGQPVGAAADLGHNRLQRGTHKGGRLQGTHKGLPPAASPTAGRGDGASRKGGRPLAGRLPAGKGNRRLRRGSDGGGDAEGERGVTLATTSYSPPSLYARVARSDWRSFAIEIHRVDTAREEDA